MARMTKAQKIRRVRILVVIDAKGHWEANGSASYSDGEARSNLDELTGNMGPAPWGYHWIEADVPMPIEPTSVPIEANVTNANALAT